MIYGLVEATDSQQLVDNVNRLIKEGWVPLGGAIFTVTSQGYQKWAQAMTNPNFELADS